MKVTIGALSAALVSMSSVGKGDAAPAPPDGAAYHHVAELEAGKEASSSPQVFSLPIEFGQGFSWKWGEDLNTYTWSGGIVPTWRVERFDFGLDLAAVYRSTLWDAAVGPRVSFMIANPFEVLVFKAGVEMDYLVSARSSANSFRASVVLSAGLGALVYFRVVPGYDFDHKSYYLLTGVGFDLAALGDPMASVLRYSSTEGPQP
jgi:hypothetical protein